MKYLIIILLLSGCYTAKKAGQQVNRAYDAYPVQTIDFLRKKAPCIDTDSSIIYKYIYKDDSTRYYQGKIDSLSKIKAGINDSLVIRYKDSCRSVIDNFNKGFQVGYEAGFYYGKQVAIPDTFLITKTVMVRDVADSVFYTGTIIKKDAVIAKLEKKKDRRNTVIWVLSILLALCGLGIYLKIKP